MFAFLATLGAFGLILVLTRLRVPLAAAIFAGAIAVGLTFGLDATALFSAVLHGAIAPMTLGVLAITGVLLLLSEVLRETGQLERIVRHARDFFRRPALAMAALPALIGLLPMPGGALFSAPMVESAAGPGRREGGTLSAVNYWFRHIWEHWWPLYPGVILAMSLTGSDLSAWILFQMPLGIFMALAGLLLFRRLHPDLHAVGPRPPAGTRRKLLRETLPVWIIIALWGAGRLALLAVPAGTLEPETRKLVEKFAPILLALLASLAWTVRANRVGLRALGRLLLRRSLAVLLMLVVSVMIFQSLIERVEAAPRIARELADFRVPVVLIVAVLPFIAGMVTGLAVGFVGVSFPIVLGLVQAMPGAPALRPYAVLAFAFGHVGMMLSPLHLCYVVSNRYFETPFRTTYRLLAGPAMVTGALAAAYFLALKAVL